MLIALTTLFFSSPVEAVEYDYVNYPLNRNVQKGCDVGVTHCIVIIPGAGSATEAHWRKDIDILTEPLPRGWGFVAFRPEPNWPVYTASDIADAISRIQDLARIFNNHNLHVVQLSDGGRVGRDVQRAGVLPQRMGLIVELDPWNLVLPIRPPSTSSEFLAYVVYWIDHRADVSYPTGPRTFSIKLPGWVDHNQVLGNQRKDAAALLAALARGGQLELLRVAERQYQRLSDTANIDLLGPWEGTVSWTCEPREGGASGETRFAVTFEDYNGKYTGGVTDSRGLYWPEYRFYVGRVDYSNPAARAQLTQALTFPSGADLSGDGGHISDGFDLLIYHNTTGPYRAQNFIGRLWGPDVIRGTSRTGVPLARGCNNSVVTFELVRSTD